jgi:hypothetical protein
MFLFTIFVNDEYTAKKIQLTSNKISKKLKTDIQMKWQWVKKGKLTIIACDFYKYD